MKAVICTIGWLIVALTVALAFAFVGDVPVLKIMLFVLKYGGGFALWVLSLLTGIYIATDGAEEASKSFSMWKRIRADIKASNKARLERERKEQEKLLAEAGLELDA